MASLFNRRTLLAAAFLVLQAPAFAAAEDVKVSIDNFAFTPDTIQVKVGSTITFTNHDDIPHSVVASDGSFHSKALDTDQSFTLTPTKAGDLAYFCGLHPHMKGKIVVVP
jgi:plastocyanin